MSNNIEVNATDPAQTLSWDVFGRILAESGNLNAAARVCKIWETITKTYGYSSFRQEFRDSSQLRQYIDAVPDSKTNEHSNAVILQATRRFQKQLQSISSPAAKIFANPAFQITTAALEDLEANACLNRFFDELLKEIPAGQRPELPDDYNKRTKFIRGWINDSANQALLKRIVELSLRSCSLTILPPEIGKLSSLIRLDLSDNQLTMLPDSICKLTALTYLNLYGNRLTNIPDSIGLLTALTNLYLACNHLKKLPDSIGLLTALKVLSLSSNHLDKLPDSIGLLIALKMLYIRDNFLTELPKSINKLTLREINFIGNPLTQTIESLAIFEKTSVF